MLMIKRAFQLPAVIFILILIMLFTVSCQQKNATSDPHFLAEDAVSGKPIIETKHPNSDVDPQQNKQREPIEISSNDNSTNENITNDVHPHDQQADQVNHAQSEQEKSEQTDAIDPEPDSTDDEKQSDSHSSHEIADLNVDDANRYYLLGISTHTSKGEVMARFPKPNDTFAMPDADGTLTIHDYGSYMIGFNDANRVVFIDVFTEEVNIGLKGIRVGATASDAIRELGEPYSQSEYVLNFKKGNTVLKMDLDPESQRILSIKLFAE